METSAAHKTVCQEKARKLREGRHLCPLLFMLWLPRPFQLGVGPGRRGSEALGAKGVKALRVCMDIKSLPARPSQGPRLREADMVSTWRWRGYCAAMIKP